MAAETIEIVFMISQLSKTLREIRQVEGAIRSANTAAHAGAGGGGFGGVTVASGRLGVAMVAATAAVAAFTAAIRSASQLAGSIGNARLFGQAGPGQAGFSAALSRVFGIDALGIGKALHEAIAAGGFARGAASQIGIGQVLPRGLGGPGDIEIFLRAVEGLRRISDVTERYNTAVRLGAEELLPLTQATERQFQTLRRLGKELETAYSPQRQLEIARIQIDFQISSLAFWTRVLKIVNGLGDMADWLGAKINRIRHPFGGDTTLQDAAARATQANTQAIEGLSVAIGQARQMFGGGSRAQGAFPAGLRGEILRRQFQADAIRLGAFSL